MKPLLRLALLLVLWLVLSGHDLFLKLDSFYLEPNSPATVALINGTFDQSDNAIARNRMLDVSIVGPNQADVTHPDTTQWHDENNAALLDFETGAACTYVIGVSTAPRTLELSADDFNEYLEHDGVLDVLEARRQDGRVGDAAREQYAKHVKAIVQVGDAQSDSYAARLGYPVELVPLQNPYTLSEGDELEVLFLKDGRPTPDQLVYASFDGHHARDDDGGHNEAVHTRTDADGIARIPLEHDGRWYVRLIHMTPSEASGLDYVSEWATLTFEIR